MIANDAQSMEMTDRVLRFKRAFEAKDAKKMAAELAPTVQIHNEGKFYTLQELLEGMVALFDTVDQTYMDVVGVKSIEVDDNEGMFGIFDVDVAWVDKRDWMERANKLTLSIEVGGKRPEESKGLVTGISVDQRADPKAPDVKDPFPPDAGGGDPAAKFNLFSFWY